MIWWRIIDAGWTLEFGIQLGMFGKKLVRCVWASGNKLGKICQMSLLNVPIYRLW